MNQSPSSPWKSIFRARSSFFFTLLGCYGALSFLICQWKLGVLSDHEQSLVPLSSATSSKSHSYQRVLRQEDPTILDHLKDSALKGNGGDTTMRTFVHKCHAGNRTFTIPTAPSFIIAGVQKGGTTSLGDMLAEHPNIINTNEDAIHSFEPHFFDWMFPDEKRRQEMMTEQNLTQDELFCLLRQEYSQNFNASVLLQNRNLLSFEKTPSYLIHSRIPDLILRTCPWKPKILVVLRNPVDRAFSHHNMFVWKNVTNETFEEAIQREMRVMWKLSLSNAPPLSSTWQTNKNASGDFAIPEMSRSELERSHKRLFRRIYITNYLQRGMYWMQIDKWKQVFGDSHLLVLNFDRLYAPQTAQSEYSRVLRFLGVSDHSMPHHMHNRGSYSYIMKKSTRRYLESFFRPHNERLASVLGDAWTGVWNNDEQQSVA